MEKLLLCLLEILDLELKTGLFKNSLKNVEILKLLELH